MSGKNKFETATHILLNEGPIAFLKTIKCYVENKYGPYRPDESKIAFDALSANKFQGLMIDVGAHYGGSLSPFAENGWQVIAFEPDSKNRKKLIKSFGGLKNVTIDSRAVSDRSNEKAVLYRSAESSGISGLSSFHSSHQAGEEVEIVTLENVFNERKIKPEAVNFLKIDTEGFDLNVLKGFPWHSASPQMILCEFEDSKTIPLGYTFHDLADFLIGHGYRIILSEWYPIKKYGSLHDWRRFITYPCELEDPKAWGNIVATKDNGVYKSLLDLCNLSD